MTAELDNIAAKMVAFPIFTATTIGLIFADIFGCFGVCSIINGITAFATTAAIETEAAELDKDLENMKRIIGGLKKSGEDFDSSIRGAIAILNGEIDLLDRWKNNAEIVKNNIDEYKVELLRKMKIIRRAFVKGLDDLEDTAEEFLARPIEILRQSFGKKNFNIQFPEEIYPIHCIVLIIPVL